MQYELTPIEAAFQEAADGVLEDLEAQQWVGPYRPDFIIRKYRLVIELDGHNYHKSREQRTADASRQRYLQREGWTVIRFTGSEIHRDVDQCVREVAQQISLLPATSGNTPEAEFHCSVRMQEVITHLCDKHGIGLPENFYARFSLGEGWLPLSIEKHGRIISVKHYFEQNGDIVFDPCIDFLIASVNQDYPDWIPLAMQTVFSRHEAGIAEEDAEYGFAILDLERQRDIANFAEIWASNLRMQGWLEHATVEETTSWEDE